MGSEEKLQVELGRYAEMQESLPADHVSRCGGDSTMRPCQRSSATMIRCSHLSQRLLDGCLARAVPVPVLPRHDLVRPRLSSSQGPRRSLPSVDAMRFVVPIKYKWKTFVPVQLRQSTALPPRGTATSPLPRPRQTTASNPPYHTRSPRPTRSPPLVKSAASEYVDRTPSYYPDDLPSAPQG